MTPAARYQAAADIIDRILAGAPAEQALTGWARASRFAGSRDRAAIRDHVFDMLRCKRSLAHLGGAMSGRALVLGLLRRDGLDPDAVFSGIGHAPAPLTGAEATPVTAPMPETVALDCPDWLAPELRRSLGADFAPVLNALRARAPVFLRVNTARISRPEAIAALQAEGIAAQPHPLAETALEVTQNPRAVHRSRPYLDGLVELQDASSQAVIAALPDLTGARVLDYCAGGGGKALAMAAHGADVTAHDAAPRRMADLPARARRAGVQIAVTQDPAGPFDLVLVDAPCSGSGTWRRNPDAKWRLDAEQFDDLRRTQAMILAEVAELVRPGGWLAYATCSLLRCENDDQITDFLRARPAYSLHDTRKLTPLTGGDGFYMALMARKP